MATKNSKGSKPNSVTADIEVGTGSPAHSAKARPGGDIARKLPRTPFELADEEVSASAADAATAPQAILLAANTATASDAVVSDAGGATPAETGATESTAAAGGEAPSLGMGSGLPTLGAVLLGGAFVGAASSGSGGGGGGSSSATTSLKTLLVQDGAIKNALVVADGNNDGKINFTDADGDGQYDEGETLLDGDKLIGKTGDDGKLTNVKASDVDGKTLLAQGGTDITTGLPVTVTYKAVAGATVINPLTTLAQELVKDGMTASEAEAKLKSALGIASGVDLSSYDLTATGADLGIRKAAIQVANILTVADGIEGVTSDAALDALAAAVKGGSIAGADKLSDSAVLASVLAAAQGAAAVDTTATIAASLAAANQAVAGSASATAAVDAQKVAQGDLTEAVKTGGDLGDFDSADDIAIQIGDKTAPTLELATLADTVLSGTEKAHYQQAYTAADAHLKSVAAVLRNSAGQAVEGAALTVAGGGIQGDLSSLADGSYTVAVTAVDKAGNSTTRTQEIRIGEGPSLGIDAISGGAVGAHEDDAALRIGGSAHNIADGQTVSVALGGKTYTASVAGKAWSVEVPAADIQALPQGVVKVTATAGSAAEVSEAFIYDTGAPAIVLGNYAINNDSFAPTTFAYAYQATDAGSGLAAASAVLKTTAGAAVEGVSLSVAGGAIKGNMPSSLANGTYVIELTATDTAGNSATQSRQFKYETTTSGSALVLDPLADSTFNASEASAYTQGFSWASGGKVTTTAVVQDSAGNAVSGVSLAVADHKIGGDLSSLADGIYRILISVTYTGGKTPETVYREQLIAIDKSAPSLTLDVPADTTLSGSELQSFALGFAAADSNGHGIATVEVAVKNSAGQTLSTVSVNEAAGSIAGLLAELPSGAYTIEVKATDLAGNSATRTQAVTVEASTVDTTRPTLSISDDTAGTARGDVAYTFTFSEAVSGFSADDIVVANGSKGAFTEVDALTYRLVVTPTEASIGELKVSVAAGVAQDAAGNQNTAAEAVQAFDTATERVAPTLVLGAKPMGADSKSAASFAYAFAASDDAGIESVSAVLKKSGTDTGIRLAVGDGVVTGNLSSLVAGTYVIEMTATDQHGNATTRSQEFTYNTSSSGTAIVLEQLADNVFNKTEAAHYTQKASWTQSTNVVTSVVVKDAAGNAVSGVSLTHDAAGKTISGDLSSLADGIYRIEVTASYRAGQDVVVREQIVVIDSNAAGSTSTATTAPLFTSSLASEAGVSANASPYFAEFADYDKDGDLDLLIGSNSTSAASKLHSNDGDGTFTDVTAAALGEVKMSLGGMAWLDYDQDGDLDIVMAGGSASTASKLLQNNGSGVFTDVAATAGIAATAAATKSLTAVDYDGDGDTDLHFAVQAGADKLYRNNGNGSFSEVAQAAGVAGDDLAQEQQALWGDFDKDGDLDLFVAVNNASGSYANSKYYSNNGNGSFKDDTAKALGDVSTTLVDAVMGDYDGDGDLDIFLPGNVAANKLLQNDGHGVFTDVALAAGVYGNTAGRAYGAEFADLDGDGKLDLVVVGVNQTQVYQNDGDGSFSEVGAATGIAATASGRDIVAADYDQDGDVDVITVGNSGTLVNVHENLKVDIDKPTVVIADNASGTATGEVTFTFTFPEPVAGFTAGDLAVANGSIKAGSFTQVSERVYTVVVTPTDESTADITVDIAAGTFADLAGNANLAATQAKQAVNTLNAAIAISDDTAGTATGAVTYTFSFNEDVSGFSADDITVSNATKGAFTAVSASVYTLAVTPIANATGNIAVSVAADAASDGVNGSLAASNSTQAFNTDVTQPELAITDNVASGSASGDIVFTFSFNETVTGFDASDVTVSNGVKGIFTTVTTGKVHTLVVSPLATGDVTVTVAAGMLTDAGGNPNLEVGARQHYDASLDSSGSIETSALGQNGFAVTGNPESAGRLGYRVAGAGDINGDGLADAVIGAYRESEGVKENAGAVYVVFGKTDGAALDVANLGDGGFRIYNSGLANRLGSSVAQVGDLNGDGLDEILVGGATETGDAAYVVYGKTDAASVDVAKLAASQGFKINGANLTAVGTWVAAGDVDGDGIDDLMVTSYSSSEATSGHVVFGKSIQAGVTGTVELTTLVADGKGIAINGAAGTSTGYSIAAAGDFNGDGKGDILVAAPTVKNSAGTQSDGAVYLVYGSDSAQNISLASLAASQGLRISGPTSSSASVQFGRYAAAAGDVNGDGLADLIVGSNASSTLGYKAYVVFGEAGGTTATIDATTLAAGGKGFVIENGSVAYAGVGSSVAHAGDINGDGLADVVVGASNANKAFVVYGKTDGTAVNLDNVAAGNGGFIVNGSGSSTGVAVCGAGDVNGDGYDDLLVGASATQVGTRTNAGEAYVIFGGNARNPDLAVDHAGTSGADSLAGTTAGESFVAGAGNDTLTGNGGADVMYGGAGDDAFVLNADNVAKLASGVTDGQLAKIDGGSGIDTLKLAGSGMTLDLTAIANVGMGVGGVDSRLESIEKIDLTGSGNNTLKLALGDVLDISGTQLFNSGNGWSGLGASVGKHQLLVTGNSGDQIDIDTSAWTQTGTAGYNSASYAVYSQGNAQLLIDSHIAVV